MASTVTRRLGAATRTSAFIAYAILAAVAAAQQPYASASIQPPTGLLRSAGAAVGAAGDVDLDGAPDLIVGFPYNDQDTSDGLTDQMPFASTPGSSGFHVWSPSTGTFIRTIVEPGIATRGFAVAN